MVILGLTGSIGMGKTVAGNVLRRLGIPVYDADAEVHDLLGPGGAAVALVEAVFPGVAQGGAVDRQELGGRVFGDDEALGRLEAILHPMVRRRQRGFLLTAALRRCPLVVLDIPLLFETGGEKRCDYSLLVTAPAFVQRQRVLARPGMSEEKLAAIRGRQMPEVEKRRRADFIVLTGLGRRYSLQCLRDVIALVGGEKGRHWP